ncbi:hypothetical protein QE152_g30012 [Popillia japonica]|uniref:Uncharacterized protein n=1 Tax=Popillia japonica TaxID=7064 RepID=A0AAW1JF18_POPJA
MEAEPCQHNTDSATTTKSNTFQECCSNRDYTILKSPQDVGPYQKASPRTQKWGRKFGRTDILADTPEKKPNRNVQKERS